MSETNEKCVTYGSVPVNKAMRLDTVYVVERTSTRHTWIRWGKYVICSVCHTIKRTDEVIH